MISSTTAYLVEKDFVRCPPSGTPPRVAVPAPTPGRWVAPAGGLGTSPASFATPASYDEALDEPPLRITTAGEPAKLSIRGPAAWSRVRCDTRWVSRL